METTFDSFSSTLSYPLVVSSVSVPVIKETIEDKVLTEEADLLENAENLIGIIEDDLRFDKGKLFNKLRKYAFKKTGDYQLAEDAVAHFYCNVARLLKEGKLNFVYKIERENGTKGNPKLFPWLYTSVRHLCIDLNRRRTSGIGGKILREYDLSNESHADSIEDPQERASKREYEKIIKDGMQQLPELQREVIRLCYLEGYKVGEVAGMLGIPFGTVKSRTNAALVNLRKILSNYKSDYQ